MLVALIVALVLRKTVVANLPACESCRRDKRQAVASVFGAWGLAVLVGAVGILAHNSGAGWLCFLLVVAALVWSAASPVLYQVPGFVVHDVAYVTLRRLNQGFLRALSTAASQAPRLPTQVGEPAYLQPPWAGSAPPSWQGRY